MKESSVVATERSARLPTTGFFISRMKEITTRRTGAPRASIRGKGIRKGPSCMVAVARNLVIQHARDRSTGYAAPKKKLKFGWDAFLERSSICRHSQADKMQKMQTSP